MKNVMKRMLTAVLSLSMVASAFAPAISAEAAGKLVNVAPLGKAVTDSGENTGHAIANVNDGDDTTSWQTKGVWPSTAVVQLDMGRTVSEVVVKLGEKGDNATGRSAMVTVQYAQNGVVSDLINVGAKRMTVDSDHTFTLSTPISATHIYVTLSEPQNSDGSTGTFWPSVEEIEVYEAQESEGISGYNNIANQAVITTTGDEHPTDGANNLVDGSSSTLYKFHNAAMTSEKEIVLKYAEARTMDAFRISFEKVGAPDPNSFSFVYSILARNGSGAYETIVANAAANRTDNNVQEYQFAEKLYSEVKIVIHSCKAGASNGWPAVAEFEVYGSEVVVEDNENIALGKSVHVSSGKNLARNITDGSTSSTWRGSYYPAYVDINLEKNYKLDTVEVFTPENGYSQYTICTSMNGRDFTKLAEKTSRDGAKLVSGESYDANDREARIVRVYLEYNSAETAAVLNEVRVTGTESGTPVQERPEIKVEKFEDSEYADTLTVTAEDTYEEVYGIIERRLGEKYKAWFDLELAENPKNTGYDFYELSTVDGKVLVKGNDGVSLATGINHFLKYYCNVNISQVGDQVTMPAQIPTIEGTVHKETKAKVRYSYNYCTLSYSMAFWGKDEWRNELDWLALNGVNVVLDATAQEEVWRRFLGKLGYEHEDIKDYIAGPAYYAWAYMANLSGFGGPVHDSWFEERTELARENQLIMRKLGMQPVLQGYSGMVPTDIKDYDSNAQIIAQGKWCSFQRPAMLVTTSAKFDEYAALFYECQKEVYGDTSDYYATDPFHEGGNTGGMNSSDIAMEVLTSMLNADKDGIWIIQAWQGNPTTALLNGLDRVENGAQHALVLDLYAEKTPHNQETGGSYGDTKEFDDTPWLFCMLNNFGGRLGLHGHLDNMAKNIPVAFNNGKHIAGIGITPEASVNNPVLYDFLFETIWQDDVTKVMEVIDLDSWLDDYATRRYGEESDAANQAWDILKDTVYKSSLNNLGQGAPESVVNARPALNINAASTWGNAVISYDKVQLEKAAELLLKDYDRLKGSEGYMYDVANVLQQVLSNSAQEYQKKMTAAYNARDLVKFEEYAEIFMEIIENMETVTATSEYFLLGRWVEQAKALGANADDFTKELYEFNAKALVTTWGSYNQAESGGLKDYSNRQWSGLIGDFYKVRWQRWIDARTSELKGEQYETNINWFQWEWEWVRSNKEYTTDPTPADLKTLGKAIIKNYTSANPAADASNDVPVEKLTITAGTLEPTEGSLEALLDGDPASFYHSNWSSARPADADFWIILELDEVTEISGLRYLPRQGNQNGRILSYEISYSIDGKEWTQITAGDWADDASWKLASFGENVEAKYVKLFAADSKADNSGRHMTGAELRLVKAIEEEPETPELPPVDENEVIRLFGDSRYDTGYAVADALKTALGVEKFEAAVVATGKNFADALAGSYLAVEKNAPILLTNGKADNIAELHAYIAANVVEGGKVYILGGEGAVPTEADAIDGYEVVRLFGDSRYDTNLAILTEAGVAGDSIIVATGKTFADSLSASAAKLPILLVKPNAALNDAQKEILAGMKNIYIVGGEGAVSEAYAEELAAFGEVTRVYGQSRYDTSVEIAKTFFEDVDAAVVASGKNFPDGLCGGPLAAAMNAPLVLTINGKTTAAADYVAEKEIKSGYVLGGDGALFEETVVEIFGVVAKTFATESEFKLAADDAIFVENKIFTEDVVISGDNAQVIFTNCTFLGNVVNTANVGTRVLVLESNVNGKFIFDNDTKEATIETNLPKFLTDAPVEAVIEDCVGSVVVIGDFFVIVNGKAYTLEECEYYLDFTTGEMILVPYEGQEAAYFVVAQWWENGEKVVMSICENE